MARLRKATGRCGWNGNICSMLWRSDPVVAAEETGPQQLVYQTQPTVGESCRCQASIRQRVLPGLHQSRFKTFDHRHISVDGQADSTGVLTRPARVQHAVFEVLHQSVTWVTFFASSCTVNYRYQCRSRATRHDDMDEQRYRSPHRRGVVGSPVTARSGHDGSGNIRTPRVPGDGRR